MKSECLKRIGFASIALLTFLGVTVAVYAADPYWMGLLWPQGKADYQIAEWTMPSGFSDDIMWGADKWGEPSSFYLARVPVEPPPGEGGRVGFGDPPHWAVAYTYHAYSGSDFSEFSIIFDEDLPQGWTDEPCWKYWISEYRIASVALHEFGHVVDFKTVSGSDTVLYSSYRCYSGLYPRDEIAIDDLY